MADPSHLSYYLDPSLPGSSIESTNSRKDAFQGAGVFFFDPEEAAFFLLRRGEPPMSAVAARTAASCGGASGSWLLRAR